MAIGPDETRVRLEWLLRTAGASLEERPIAFDAPVRRARRAIRLRAVGLAAGAIALAVVLTVAAVLIGDRLSGEDGGSQPTKTVSPAGSASASASGSPTDEPSTEPPSPPTVTITSGPTPLTKEPAATFTFTVDPPGRTTCILNGQPIEPCEGGVTVTAMEGPNTFVVRGVDAEGNEGPPATVEWILDRTPPTVTLTSIDLVYGSESLASECRVDAEPVSCVAPISGLSGPHTFYASVGTGITWAFDATPLEAVAFVADATLGSFGTSQIRLAFTTSEEATLACSSEGSEIPCDGMVLVDEQSADEGETVTSAVRVVATDAAGNSGEATLTWAFSVATSVD